MPYLWMTATGFLWGCVFQWLVSFFLRHRSKSKSSQEGVDSGCTCGHFYSFHDKEGGCKKQLKFESKWHYEGFANGYEYRECECQVYDGPQPIETLYARELKG